MFRAAVATLLLVYVNAQCGPGGAVPYPAGASECPDQADESAVHNSGVAPVEVVAAPAAVAAASSGGTCVTPPCPAALLGDIGFTSVSGTEAFSGVTFPVGENIFGPFEAGFSAAQDQFLAKYGCATGKGYIIGGVDTQLAEQVMALDCGVTLPRMENGRYVSLMDQCGGHTLEYHFHQKMSCLYKYPGGGHSTQVGKALDMQPMYGKYEDDSTDTLPLLDACGGHFGVTPDSAGAIVYHYHVQDKAPHTVGCFGPATAANGSFTLVTLAQCRALYSGCGDGDVVTFATAAGNVAYDPWCPCFDATGSNIGTAELAVFSTPAAAASCSGATCTGFQAVSASAGVPTGMATTFSLPMMIASAIGALCVGGGCVASLCFLGGSKGKRAHKYMEADEEDEETGTEEGEPEDFY